MLLEKENQNCINKITNMQTKIQKCKDMVEAHMETISKSKVYLAYPNNIVAPSLVQKTNSYLLTQNIAVIILCLKFSE